MEKGRKFVPAILYAFIHTIMCVQVVAKDRWKGSKEGGICNTAEKSDIPVRLLAKRSQ